MIPKILHTVWVGRTREPNRYVDLRSRMADLNPDWTVLHWDNDLLGVRCPEFVPFLDDKPVIAADIMRVWAVMTYGGIYLDSDIRLIRPLDDAIRLHMGFLMQEPAWNGQNGRIGNCVIGALPHDGTLATCHAELLDRVLRRKLKDVIGATGPRYWTDRASLLELNGWTMLPCETFAPFHPKTEEDLWYVDERSFGPETYGIHEFGGSWRTDRFNWAGSR